MTDKTRTEKDPLGALEVPADALYGVQTLRAVQNFPISGLNALPAFVDATVRIKRAAALTHKETGRLDARLADAIVNILDNADVRLRLRSGAARVRDRLDSWETASKKMVDVLTRVATDE